VVEEAVRHPRLGRDLALVVPLAREDADGRPEDLVFAPLLSARDRILTAL
jgi:hypothetical protein